MASITQLQYVVAVDQCRHFGRAAELCHVSQPTLSAQLQKLEDELGVVLFDRNKQPILPTDDGKAFIEQAKVVVTEFNRLQQMAENKNKAPSGEIHLAVIPTVAPYLLPLFLKSMNDLYPEVHMVIEELSTEKIIEAIDRDLLDAAILATPLKLARIQEIPLYYEAFSLFVGSKHQLAGLSRVSRDMLSPQDVWVLTEEHCLRQQILEVCGGQDRGGCFPSVTLKGGSLETIIELVSQGNGYTLLPQMVVDSLAKKKVPGKLVEMSRPVPTREISLVFRRGHLKQSLIQILREQILHALPKTVTQEKTKSMNVIGVNPEL